MTVPTDLKYTDSHEWARLNADGTVSVGITHHAQDRLGDLVYVENPEVGKRFQKGQECGVVESVKAASDIYAPVSGEVVAINEELSANPERINQDAYAAWMFKLKPSDPAELGALLDAAGYQRLVEAEEH
jgi:glycine cleavage system H protein